VIGPSVIPDIQNLGEFSVLVVRDNAAWNVPSAAKFADFRFGYRLSFHSGDAQPLRIKVRVQCVAPSRVDVPESFADHKANKRTHRLISRVQ
jgi:hypothetical protein